MTPSTRPATPNRPSGGNGSGYRPPSGNGNTGGNHPPSGNGNYNRPPNSNGNGSNYSRPPNTSGNGNTINRGNTNISGNTVNRNVVVANPVYRGPAYGWNHGVVWAPAYGYYGGGFWGAFAIGVTSAAVYGTIVNSATHVTYTSYQTQPSSPGATLLSNYQLTQVQCGPPNLVVIYGPENSVICANPNQLVAAGEYNLDTSTLSLTNA
jgi:hypothetical protein